MRAYRDSKNARRRQETTRLVSAQPKVFHCRETALDRRQQRLDFHLFDAKHGTDTSGVIPLSNLTLADSPTPGCLWYEAASPVIFRQLMAALEIPFSDFAFVDYGSGKGRLLMLAAEQGFRKVTGIEFAVELVGVARRNAEIFNRGRVTSTAIETLHMDARDYVLPDVPLVLFFFSPFKGAVLDRANQHHRVLRAKSPPALHAARNRSKNFMPRDFPPAKFRLNATELDLSTTAASSSPHLTEE